MRQPILNTNVYIERRNERRDVPEYPTLNVATERTSQRTSRAKEGKTATSEKLACNLNSERERAEDVPRFKQLAVVARVRLHPQYERDSATRRGHDEVVDVVDTCQVMLWTRPPIAAKSA